MFIACEIRQRARNVSTQCGQFVCHRLVRGFLRRSGRLCVAVAFVEIENPRIQFLLDSHELLADVFAGTNFIRLRFLPDVFQARQLFTLFVQSNFLHAHKSRINLLDSTFQLAICRTRLTIRPGHPTIPPRAEPIHVTAGRRILLPFLQQPFNPFIFSMITAFANRLQIIAAILERRLHLVVFLLVLLHLII